MKKLLYTLLIGLVVISCNKDNDGADYSSINPSQEIEASLKSTDFDAAVDRLLGKLNNKVSNASTAKTAVAGSYLLFLIGGDASTGYEIFIGDDIEVCNTGDFISVYLVYQSNSLTTVHLGSVGADVHSELNVDLTSAMSADLLFLGDKIDYVNQSITAAAGSGSSITFN